MAADFSFLDSASLRSSYGYGEGLNQISFFVGGVKCGRCVHTLESLTESVPGPVSLRVDLNQKVARAEVDPTSLEFSTLAKAIEKAGFEPVPLAAESDADRLRRREDRMELIRLAVAAACAGNIMSFAFANYFGSSPEWRTVFNWLSFALYLPVVTFVAWPFYQGAWSSLKGRRLSIDLPMAVASAAGFLYSTVQLLRGRDDIYFDSLASFLFLILLSRAGQKRLQRKFLKPLDLGESLALLKVRKITNEGWSWTARADLKPNDKIRVEAEDILPCDAELVSEFAHVSTAFLSGEEKPKTYQAGGLIPAGARFLSGPVELKFIRPLEDTVFGRLIDQTNRADLRSARVMQISDLWAQRLLITVFTIAALFVALYWMISPEEALRRGFALIILACPCAMAFGTPLALSRAIKRASQFGFLIGDGSVFETLARAKSIYIDKTGTLTETDLALITDASSISSTDKSLLLALESRSAHPVAFALRKAFDDVSPASGVTNLTEKPGFGVRGVLDGKTYEFIKAPSLNSLNSVSELRRDGETLLRLEFRTAIKSGSVSAVNQLRGRGLNVYLLSGDNDLATRRLGSELGFKSDEIFGDQTPDDKMLKVKDAPDAVMIGDGVNDALALAAASVGIAVSNGTETAFRNAKVIMTSPGLSQIAKLFDLSLASLAAIKLNLRFSVVYNVVAGTAALLGFINPYVAALLMPLSSGLILFFTWIGGRE